MPSAPPFPITDDDAADDGKNDASDTAFPTTTAAHTASPNFSSGRGNTAHSTMVAVVVVVVEAKKSRMTRSTSEANTDSPPVRITSSARPESIAFHSEDGCIQDHW